MIAARGSNDRISLTDLCTTVRHSQRTVTRNITQRSLWHLGASWGWRDSYSEAGATHDSAYCRGCYTGVQEVLCAEAMLVLRLLNEGNDVVPRANVLAHLNLYDGGHLTPIEIETFEKMYGFRPNKRSFHTPKLLTVYDMMGTGGLSIPDPI